MTRRAPGFTLIELMIVVAVIGILAAIAIPKFAELIRKSNEGKAKGDLGAVRSALSIYYGDNEGIYPDGGLKVNPSTVLAASLVPKYMAALPTLTIANYHPASSQLYNHEVISAHNHDFGYWGYDGVSSPSKDPQFGDVWIMCFHTDTKGSLWSAY